MRGVVWKRWQLVEACVAHAIGERVACVHQHEGGSSCGGCGGHGCCPHREWVVVGPFIGCDEY